eukprot:1005940-Rhodomonas_salina.2
MMMMTPSQLLWESVLYWCFGNASASFFKVTMSLGGPTRECRSVDILAIIIMLTMRILGGSESHAESKSQTPPPGWLGSIATLEALKPAEHPRMRPNETESDRLIKTPTHSGRQVINWR